jgi:endonuclease/exonuclease/phosphatase family metal-dependent hydrolase
MVFLTGRLPRRALVIGLALAFGAALVTPAPAASTSVRLLVWDLNACDQFGQGNADCEVTPTQRASAIVQSINSTSWSPNVVTLQEMCRSTFDIVVASLSSSWVSHFHSTYTTTDSRCQSVDHAWGIAVLARSEVLSNPSAHTLGVEMSGERRTLLCIDVRVTVPVRACTTHLTATSQATAASQAATAAHLVDQWIAADNTVVVGGDVNLDVRQCGNTDVSNGLRPWYHGPFGAGVTRCYAGFGSMYEVDRYRAGGDGVYDEATHGSAKLDVVFGDRWHVYEDHRGDVTSTSFSDHDLLRGAMTAHDVPRRGRRHRAAMSTPSHPESTPTGRPSPPAGPPSWPTSRRSR